MLFIFITKDINCKVKSERKGSKNLFCLRSNFLMLETQFMKTVPPYVSVKYECRVCSEFSRAEECKSAVLSHI